MDRRTCWVVFKELDVVHECEYMTEECTEDRDERHNASELIS